MIKSTGPRYCPSIEDKVVRFADKNRHQVFIEPEGLYTSEVYIGGMSSSMPEDVQYEMYRSVKGLENARIVRNAYAIEYDCIDSLELKPSLECKKVEGLFSAGQANGSSGYEEAAAQGIIAGINAARKLQKKRYEGTQIRTNSMLGPGEIRTYIPLGSAERKLMEKAFERMGGSHYFYLSRLFFLFHLLI